MIRSLIPLPLRRAVALAICPEVAQPAPPVVHVVHINTHELAPLAGQDLSDQRRGAMLRAIAMDFARHSVGRHGARPVFNADTFAASGMDERSRYAALSAVKRVMADPRVGITEKTLAKCLAAFAAVWPEGLAWPEGIDRPAPATVLRLVK